MPWIIIILIFVIVATLLGQVNKVVFEAQLAMTNLLNQMHLSGRQFKELFGAAFALKNEDGELKRGKDGRLIIIISESAFAPDNAEKILKDFGHYDLMLNFMLSQMEHAGKYGHLVVRKWDKIKAQMIYPENIRKLDSTVTLVMAILKNLSTYLSLGLFRTGATMGKVEITTITNLERNMNLANITKQTAEVHEDVEKEEESKKDKEPPENSGFAVMPS